MTTPYPAEADPLSGSLACGVGVGERTDSIRLPADSTSPRRARLFVDEVLHRWRRDGAIERLALIADVIKPAYAALAAEE